MFNWLFQRLRPPTEPAGPRPRDLAVEALRGFCALVVLYVHLFASAYALDPRYAPSAKFYYFNLGPAAVLVFFVLSGYVIGLTARRPASAVEIRQYARRRLLRLLPVTYAALAVTWLLAPVFSGRTVVGHLLFLSNDLPYPWLGLFPLLQTNPNLWSLTYEAVYYTLFVGLWLWAPRFYLVLGAAALLTVAPALDWPVAPVFGRLACGSFYWLAGLGIAWLTEECPAAGRRSNWPAALFCAYAIWALGPLRTWLYDCHFDSFLWLTAASPHRLDFLPVCLWLLLAVTGRAPRAQVWLTIGCLAWASLGWGRAWLNAELKPIDFLAGGALGLALAIAGWKPSLAWFSKLAPVGTISFGLYVLGGPIQLAFRTFVPVFSGTAYTYAIRVAVALALIATAAWLVERKFQPWIAARFRR